MGKQKKSKGYAKRAEPKAVPAAKPRGWRHWWIAFLFFPILAFGYSHFHGKPTADSAAPLVHAASAFPTLIELAGMPPDQLKTVDVALMNLRCAEGMRGSEGLDIPAALKTIDQYAARVDSETTRNLHKFRDNPGEFQNSEPYFRLLMMAFVMQEDFGVRYNPALIPLSAHPEADDGFSDNAKYVFLNGLTGAPMMGTCSSMPVLYVAVGRRIGYPLYLVPSKSHLFARWDDGRTRLNMEGTSHGFGSHTDDEYKTSSPATSDAEIEAEHYFVSMSPSEELAVFLPSVRSVLLQ